MTRPPNALTVAIDWSQYGVSASNSGACVQVALNTGLGPSFPLDKIRSISIDNTFSQTPVYVYFPDTQLTYFAPANSFAVLQVSTSNFEFYVFVEGVPPAFIPFTVIEVTNSKLAPIVIYNNVSRPVVKTAAAAYTENNVNSITYTPTLVQNSAPDRVVAVAFMVFRSMYTTPVINPIDVTINGQPLVRASSVIAANSSAGAIWYSGIYYLAFPYVSNPTIFFGPVAGGLNDRIFAQAYEFTRVLSPTPYAFAAGPLFPAVSLGGSFGSLPFGAAGLGASVYVRGAPPLGTVSISGATLDASTSITGGGLNMNMSTASFDETPNGPYGLAFAPSSGFAAAAWR